MDQNTNQKPNINLVAKPVQQLLTKEVNRQEFLSIVGLGVLTVIGMGPIVHFLTGKKSKVAINNQQTKRGYGGGAYGV